MRMPEDMRRTGLCDEGDGIENVTCGCLFADTLSKEVERVGGGTR